MKKVLLACLCSWPVLVMADTLKGRILDADTQEGLFGATIQVEGTSVGAVADIDGNYELAGLSAGQYTLVIRYVGYEDQRIEKFAVRGTIEHDFTLSENAQALQDVVVSGQSRTRTESAVITKLQTSGVVMSGISTQQIQKAQDRDASEVIRRIPGISIIEDKFVMVRGLSQRYNNVWINGSSVPSSEADSRAFSFDIIPASQLDNMMIIKSPSAEYPADFTGGFVLINTKEVPDCNSFSVTLGGTLNDRTHFRNFLQTDDAASSLTPDGSIESLPTANWKTEKETPYGDWNAAAQLTRFKNLDNGQRISLMASVNYTDSYKTLSDMENSLFGAYDTNNDRSNYLRHSTDWQYNHNTRLGGMLNLSWVGLNERNKVEFKNIANRLTKERYTFRTGTNAQSDMEETAEFYHQSRMTYNGQLTGTHKLQVVKANVADQETLDWSVGYAYANRDMPDRRRYLQNDKNEPGVIEYTAANDVSREFTRLDEHIGSASVNYSQTLPVGSLRPTLKVGGFYEYRTREYETHYYLYNWYNGNKLAWQLVEEVKWRNNYEGNNNLGAGYLSLNVPYRQWNLLAGVRYEANTMELISNTRDYQKSPKSTKYRDRDFFPSFNLTCKLHEDPSSQHNGETGCNLHQLRLAYGRSVNRAEFREVSSSVFYDFDLASDVQGNTDLKSCYVQNLDFRYEWYPRRGESFSIAAFYKHFENPIEWTYTVQGGTDLTYSYKNAKSARNMGIEIDIRKNLDVIGLKDFSWSFNGSWIHSKVDFEKGSREKDRPMQGQSPYLINTGLFYQHESLSVALLYNRIGKRIIGVGRSVGSTGSDDTANIPHSYEMPRNAFDLTASYKWGEHLELKAAVKDILGEKVTFKQFTDATHRDGTVTTVDEVTKQYKPGRNFSLSLTYSF